MLAIFSGEAASAASFAEEALALYRERGDEKGAAEALRWLGNARNLAGDTEGARRALEQSVDLLEHGDAPLQLARALLTLGIVVQDAGDLDRAEELMRRTLVLGRGAEARFRHHVQHSLGDVALDRRDLAAARRRFTEILAAIAAWDTRMAAHCIGGLAAVEAYQGEAERAGRLWGAIVSVEQELGPQILGPERARYTGALAHLEGPKLALALEAGRDLTLAQAINEAVSVD